MKRAYSFDEWMPTYNILCQNTEDHNLKIPAVTFCKLTYSGLYKVLKLSDQYQVSLTLMYIITWNMADSSNYLNLTCYVSVVLNPGCRCNANINDASCVSVQCMAEYWSYSQCYHKFRYSLTCLFQTQKLTNTYNQLVSF